MHRLDLGLYSHPKEFWGGGGGMEFEPMLTPREKSPLPKKSPEEDRTRDAVDSEPKHYQLSYSGPCQLFKRAGDHGSCIWAFGLTSVAVT